MSSPSDRPHPEDRGGLLASRGALVGSLLSFACAGAMQVLIDVFGLPRTTSTIALCFAAMGAFFIVPAFLRLRAPVEYMAGCFLLVLAGVGFFGSLNLNFQTSTGVGPGMMPRATAVIVAALGALLIIEAFFSKGGPLERWSIRGIVFVLGAALIFSYTIRPLGLVVAGPLAVIFAAFADRQTRIIEVLPFAAIMTAFCVGLFSYALRLPIPITPTTLPWPINDLVKLVPMSF